MKHIRIYEEFVPVQDYKKWKDYYNKKFYEKIGDIFKKYQDHDKNYNRIYFDLKVDTEKFEIVVPDEISDYMRWYGYPILDYKKGICRDKDGRQIRIGKLFVKLGEDKLLKTYNDSRQNLLKNVDDLQVVISRHPYDIIGMSTNRGWTTCHDLNDKRYNGEHLYGVKHALEDGSLIAYVIRKNDRNIKNPISRCLIEYSNYSDKLSVDVKHVYGTKIPEFVEFLQQWSSEQSNIFKI